VTAVGNGPDGIALLEKTGYDIVVTDLKMTPMDGLEVVRQAARLCPDTPVIVMTAYGTIETAVAALKEGAVDYILKPSRSPRTRWNWPSTAPSSARA